MDKPRPQRCARCGRELDSADCFLLAGPGDGERAGFCRLEHIIPWVMRGAAWDEGGHASEGPLVLTRHRMGHEIEDRFDAPEALRAWASGGGRWGG